MYEELIKNLRGCREGSCKECRLGNRSVTFIDCMTALMEEAADAIEVLDMKLQGANAAIAGMQREIERMVIDSVNSKPKWIPVAERLPENPHGLRREYFLVALESGCVESLGYDFDCNRWHISGSPVTHWMPLPQPPVDGI